MQTPLRRLASPEDIAQAGRVFVFGMPGASLPAWIRRSAADSVCNAPSVYVIFDKSTQRNRQHLAAQNWAAALRGYINCGTQTPVRNGRLRYSQL